MNITQFIKRQGELAINLIALATCFGTIILLFGGHLPPWATPADILGLQAQQKTTAAILDGLNKTIDRKACDDYVARLQRANAALERNPNDMSAMDLQNASEDSIRRIPNCSSPSP